MWSVDKTPTFRGRHSSFFFVPNIDCLVILGSFNLPIIYSEFAHGETKPARVLTITTASIDNVLGYIKTLFLTQKVQVNLTMITYQAAV